MDKLILENGKYEIEFNGLESSWNIKRHGEKWSKVDLYDLPHGKMLIAMFYEAIEGTKRLNYVYDGFNMALSQLQVICESEVDNIDDLIERIKEMKVKK